MADPGSDRSDPSGVPDVAAAMAALDRRAFLPADQHASAHEDRPLPIGLGQTCSQPSTVAAMLRLLDVPPGARVLDVGAGSGWTTALLALLVGPHGSVLGVELEPELAERAAACVAAGGTPWARVVTARPGVLGWPDGDGYDRILCSASPRALPDELVQQLRDGGRLVLPVEHTMWVVDRRGEDVVRRPAGSYRFVPLRSRPGASD
ncbi:protein-L-isoaspartate O-methyltransferase family protein [Cellulomonas aerilata]|uniref:protein-L-isoaspartate O-methyltransferase family protein n=1 Tax=Cellulomonas aerilata TaxID=515326 RepID=UPI0011BE7483|nr:methyltransferase domain-containing protein [Cellulomonas aerilata]